VETLWTNRHEKKVARQVRPKTRDQIFADASFDAPFACFTNVVRATVTPRCAASQHRSPPPNVVNVHRYEERIAGRTYLIEVRLVSQTRWRAQIARLPGLPSSMMPFYGATPEQAARELSRWLALVYNGNTKQ
jgi:hypothetical protein